jgi:hypothetical protein
MEPVVLFNAVTSSGKNCNYRNYVSLVDLPPTPIKKIKFIYGFDGQNIR